MAPTPRKQTGQRGGAPTPAVVQPQRYLAPEGWELGQRAPENMYAPVGVDGQPDLDKLSSEPPEGYGVQLVAKGDTVTSAMLRSIGRANPGNDLATAAARDLVRTPVPEPQGPGQVQADAEGNPVEDDSK